MLKSVLRSLVLSFSVLLLIAGIGRTQDVSLTVAVEPVYPPFEFRGANGEIQGFDIDVIRAIGQEAGFKVNFQSIAFDGIIPALQARTVDAAVGAMTITPARSQVVTFSRPYFNAGLAIAVREGTQTIDQLEDLRDKAIAVQIGTTGAEQTKQISGAKVRTFNAAVLTLQELRNGNVDAVINDAPVMLYAIKTGNLKGIRLVNQLLTEEFYGIPTPRNSPHLPRINQGLGTILTNGTYDRLYQKWFNAQPPPLPETAPTSATGNSNAVPGTIQVILQSLPPLLAGTLITLELTAIAGVLGLIGGSLIGILRLSSVPQCDRRSSLRK